MQKSSFFQGAAILTVTGLSSRVIGFFYRILLSHIIGAEGLGIYQLIFPVQGLLMALTASGFQLTISRDTAACYARENKTGAIQTFLTGCFFSVLLSTAAAFLIFRFRIFFGTQLLREPRTIPLLWPLAASLPLCAIHSCVNSYYYGKKETLFPSLLQLAEQGIRVLSVCLLCQILLSEGKIPSPVIALYGILISEILSSLCSLLAIGIHFKKVHFSFHHMTEPGRRAREILCYSLPLTANRVLLTLLSSIEIILIPRQLQTYGLTNSQALTVYGVFTGMALPLLLFPTTITNSIATMLLPSIAELQALKKENAIQKAVTRLLQFGLLFGGSCGLLYFFFGDWMGMLLFQKKEVGMYLQILAFICPFLYLNTSFSGVLHGLGYAGISLLHSIISVGIRLFFVIRMIPIHGIRGYLWGILAGEVTLFVLNLYFFYRKTDTNG